MIWGSAAAVADWSPPPSCMMTIDPGRTLDRTLTTMAVEEILSAHPLALLDQIPLHVPDRRDWATKAQ